MNHHKHKKFLKKPVTVALGTTLLFLSSQLAGGVVGEFFYFLHPTNNNVRYFYYALGGLLTLGLLLLPIMKFSGYRLTSLGFRKVGLKQIMWVVPLFLFYMSCSLILTFLAIKLIPGFDVDQTQEIGFKALQSRPDLIIAFISLVILTPLFEEVIFRGILFRGFRKSLSFWWSALLTSVVFAVAHGQLNVALDTFALSLVLCWLVERYASLMPALLLHSLKNTVAFSLLFLL